MLNYQSWLEKPGLIKVLLVQVDSFVNGVLSTKYLSTHQLVVSGVTYSAVLKNGFDITESISVEYAASISYGDIEIYNANGEYDSWLSSSHVWVNKPIRIYYGELPKPGVTTVIDDYEQVFDGIVSDLDSKDRFTLNLKIRDKLEKLNTSLSETLLGNYYNGSSVPTTTYVNQNSNSLRPVCFGEVFNVTPLLTDPVNLHYMINTVAVESILEVRDNGVPVQFSTAAPVPAGSFRLTQTPVGTVTCSVQGTKQLVNTTTGAVSSGYSATASNTILTILRNYGKGLAASEVELSSFLSLGAQSVGVYLTDRSNVLQVCQDIAKHCGLVVSTTRLGKVKLVDLAIPTSATVTITDRDVLLNSFSLSRKIDVIAGVKIGYSRNYTQQQNLLTAIPQDHKDFFASTYAESLAKDDAVKSTYSITTEPVLEETYLIEDVEAATVAQKKLNLFKTPRFIYKMTCTAKYLSLQVGDSVLLNNISRYNISNTYGLVVSTKPNWMKESIEVEVLV